MARKLIRDKIRKRHDNFPLPLLGVGMGQVLLEPPALGLMGTLIQSAYTARQN